MHRADLSRRRAFGTANLAATALLDAATVAIPAARRLAVAALLAVAKAATPAARRPAVTALLAVAASAIASAAAAQTPRREAPSRADVVSQEIEVLLAEVEVVVTDRRGEPVVGLTREDFELFQDGRAVELTHFRATGDHAAAAAGTGDEAAAAGTGDEAAATEPGDRRSAPGGATDDRLHLVIYIDRGYLEPGDLKDVRPALKEFLRQALGPGDRVMLVTAAGSLELRQGFTSLPELAISKLDDVRERAGGGQLTREYQSILSDMRRIKSEGSDLMARDPSRQARIFVSRIQAYAAEVEGEIGRTTAQLRQLIQSIAGLPGRRAVLYVGGRVPAAHGRRLFDAWDEAFGRSSSQQIADNPGTAGLGVGGGSGGADAASFDTGLDSLAAASASFRLDAQRSVQEAADAASAHGVVFHTLDAASLRGPTLLAAGDVTLQARGSAANPGAVTAAGSLADSLASLSALAWGTGGRAFAGSRNFAGALARVGSDLETYYSLGFEPLEPKGDSSRIEVRLRRADARGGRGKLAVRHRAVLELKDRDTLEAERTISALLLEEMDNPLAVEVSAGEPTVAKKGEWRVPVTVTVPLARLALVADGRVHAGRLSVYTAAGGLERIETVTKAVVPVRIPNRDLLTSLGRRVAYRLELTLPGPERIAVTVRDDFRPRSSTAATTAGIERPAGGAGAELDSR